jgi:hypothetical protein
LQQPGHNVRASGFGAVFQGSDLVLGLKETNFAGGPGRCIPFSARRISLSQEAVTLAAFVQSVVLGESEWR